MRRLLTGAAWLTASMIGIATAGALPATAPYPLFPEDPKSHHWEKLGAGVYAFISPIGITPIVSGNSLVVDTGKFPSLARAEIAEIQRLTPLPVRYIVTTHWHPDHWSGNGEFARAYPGVAIIATPNTRELAQSHGAADVSPEYPRGILEAIGKTLARGAHGDGRPLLPSERPYLEIAQLQFENFDRELAHASRVHPNTIFHDSLDLYLGNRLVQVKFLGRGNTGGDAGVYVPDAKVLATGDLIVNPFPYGTGSFYGEWLATLRTLSAMDTESIVPGHGEVEHDKAYLTRRIRLLETVQKEVIASVHAGLTLEATLKKVTLADAKVEFCAGRPFQGWCEQSFEGNFVTAAVTRTYKEEEEGPLKSED